MGVIAGKQLKESTLTFLIASFGKQKQVSSGSLRTTSFPGSLILPLAPGGGKIRDPRNEVGLRTDEKRRIVTKYKHLALLL